MNCQCDFQGEWNPGEIRFCKHFDMNQTEYAHEVCKGLHGEYKQTKYHEKWGNDNNKSPLPIVKKEINREYKESVIKREETKRGKIVISSGPGTELKLLISSLGLSGASGCGCNNKAALMDSWGISGCQERREDILTWLRGQYKKRSWLETLKAGINTITTGLLFSIDPLDPAPGILEEALRRAEAKLAPKEP